MVADALSCNENRVVEDTITVHGKGTCRVATIRGGKRSAKSGKRAKRRAARSGPVVRIGRPDASLTGLAGLVAVDEVVAKLGLVAELDLAVGPIKQRQRGASAGRLLVGMATGLLAGQDCLAGLDRVRADPGSGLLVHAPVPAATTAAGLARRFDPRRHGPERLAGIEAGLAKVYQHWLRLVPAAVRAPLVLRAPTIDLDATDIEVYGTKKDRVGWNYAGVKSGRVHLASWAQAELPLAADLLAGNDDVRPDAAGLLRRALAVLPPAVCGRPRVRADAGYFDQSLAHAAVDAGCDYAIAAKRNQAAWRAFAAIQETAWSDARDMPGGQVAVCDYTPAGWPEGSYCIVRRVKVSATAISADPRSRRRRTIPADQLALALDGQAEHAWACSFIVTNIAANDGADIVALEVWFRRRTSIEDRFRDGKHGGGLNHLPSGDHTINTVWTWATLLAGALSVMLQSLIGWHAHHGERTRTPTLRHRLLTIPGRILRHARSLTLRLPAGHTALADALQALRALPPPG